MTSHEPPTRISEISAAPLNLALAMRSAAKAIRRALTGLEPESSLSLEAVLSAFREVERVGALRRFLRTSTPQDRGPEIHHDHSDYLSALTEWERQLPRLHGWLLSERSRLGSRRNHTRLVYAWMNADQETR